MKIKIYFPFKIISALLKQEVDYSAQVYRRRNKFTHPIIVKYLFCMHLGTMYANFREKIFAEISGKKFQTFHYSNVTTMKSLGIISRNLHENFFLENWHA